MLRLVTAVLLSFTGWCWHTAYAWYPPVSATPYYPPYAQATVPFYEQYAPGYGMYGQVQPRWYLRGRINRYGDYQFDLKLQGLSRFDMYRARLLYQQLRLYRRLYAR